MPYETVRYEVDELIRTITLSRPDDRQAASHPAQGAGRGAGRASARSA